MLKRETGIVIENKKIDSENNQLSIKVSDLNRIPDIDNSYLITTRSHPLRNKYHFLNISKVPDENNLLTFTVYRGHDLAAVKPGSKVKIKGPFKKSTTYAG